ncbi:hypothetical protein ACIBEJ_34550 [Nonomuraea sp. NPDC050790]|uniref:hypothetical protein n=1 Tax=Nonomuraea sp. NPDC050790 TaxID=3364371 RepID=UPI003787659D
MTALPTDDIAVSSNRSRLFELAGLALVDLSRRPLTQPWRWSVIEGNPPWYPLISLTASLSPYEIRAISDRRDVLVAWAANLGAYVTGEQGDHADTLRLKTLHMSVHLDLSTTLTGEFTKGMRDWGSRPGQSICVFGFGCGFKDFAVPLGEHERTAHIPCVRCGAVPTGPLPVRHYEGCRT